MGVGFPKSTKAIVFCVATLLTTPVTGDATSFVLVSSGTKLYIGADGMRVIYETQARIPHCKIAINGGTVTLTWGLAAIGRRSPNGQEKWSLFSTLVDPISASNGTVIEKRDALLPKAKQFVIDQMNNRDAHSNSPVTDETMVHSGIGAAFISTEQGIFRLAAFNLQIRDWVKRDIRVEEAAYQFDRTQTVAYGAIQAYEEIAEKSATDSSIQVQASEDPAGFIRKVLTRQHEITPKDVGPPYSVGVLEGGRFTWIDKGACRE